jgi:glycosyltransferase involved in cell wall biosynthesis
VKALLFANTDWYLYNFRLPLAKALRARGWEVVLVSPPGEYGPRLEREGFRWIAFDFSRKGTNPFGELVTLYRLIRLYRREKPDLAHHFTIKCVIYGGLAARMAGARATVNAVTGMGHVFTTHSLRNRMLRPLIGLMYRSVLNHSLVIFQNPDDRAAFLELGLIRENRTRLIRGSGVNTARFTPSSRGETDAPQVLMVGRLLKEKGVTEYVDAAEIVRAAIPGACLKLAGDPDPGNPSSVTPEQLASWKAKGTVEFLGHRDDMEALLAASHLAVLPSYREGTPRSLLEAAAAGLPLVATDVPGCREVVRHGHNGLLVPASDSKSLAQAIITLLRDPALRARMGSASRVMAETEFSEDRVIADTLAVYDEALGA